MFGGQNTGVEEHQGHDQPEHPLGLADLAALAPHRSVPPAPLTSVADLVSIAQ